HEPIHVDTPRLATSMRGTGCMQASAIAANLAKAKPLEDSVLEGKLFVFERLRKVQPKCPQINRNRDRVA
ncbi:MAG: hypothetical protein EOQ41_32435, partial [Mesorhizobium sp.]|uniref:bifunctional hydroxymethylpyrimidine kinase/phosphomethylpyrimidine kinase n=1 Tax=Mesorhizobium sp. TaxID=1871066 RepID=UPI000FE6810F